MKHLMKTGQTQRISEKGRHSFFGFYGKSPWNINERFFVYLEVDFIDRHPTDKDFARIILIDFEKNSKIELAKTKAWNWQQGCMIQWIPGSSNKIIFNDAENGKLISRIIDVQTKKEVKIPFPIYDIHPSGKYALSVSFEKLNYVRKGYGYEGGKTDEFAKNISEKEGVYLINLVTKKRKLILPLEKLYNYKTLPSMDSGRHWIDQPVFSPDGKRFCVLHRWELKGGLFHTRFFTAGVEEDKLHCFPDSGFYSHFIWRNPKEILMFCSVSEGFAQVRKDNLKSRFLLKFVRPIYRRLVPRSIRKRVIPIGYYLLKDQTKEVRKINVYNDDGHPCFSPDGKNLITDTYPDSGGYRKLILFNWAQQKGRVLGEFYSIPNKRYIHNKIPDFGNSPFRADLHPRWDRKNEKVCFDSMHEGYRGVYVTKTDKCLKK